MTRIGRLRLAVNTAAGAANGSAWNALTQLACFGFWFSLPFTQHRIGDIGLSELCGLLSIFLIGWSGRIVFKSAFLVVLFIHIVMCAFTVIRVFNDQADMVGPVRDMVAVTYSVLAAIVLVNLMAESRSAIVASLLGMRASVYVSLVALAFSLLLPGSVDVWFSPLQDDVDEPLLREESGILPRFVSFSTNPNQFAFYVLFSLFFTIIVNWKVFSFRIGLEFKFFVLVCLLLLFLTQSDAAMLAVGVGVSLIFVGRYLVGSPYASVLVGYLIACFSAVVLSILWRWGLGDDAGNGRLNLWFSAARVIDEAGGVGLGYGAHVPDLFRVVNESHSVVFDFMLFGGVIGGALFFGILAFHLWAFFRPQGFWMAVPSLVIMVFCLTYSPLRHPIFWVAVLLPVLFGRTRFCSKFVHS